MKPNHVSAALVSLALLSAIAASSACSSEAPEAGGVAVDAGAGADGDEGDGSTTSADGAVVSGDGGTADATSPPVPSTHFNKTATTWEVPARGSVSGFNSTTWSGGGNAVWFTFDLNGDGKTDLVQTSDPANGNVWGGDGAASWKVFLSTGTGFSKTATTWDVPSRGSVSGFDSMSWSGGGNAIWYTLDVNGDGKADLVQTSDPANGRVWNGDAAGSWKVFLNTGTGFSKTATTWAVPPRGSITGFNSTTWSGGGNAIWYTADLNADGKPDLVQTSDPANGLVWGGDAAASWKVFLNTGSGFGPATTWAVPARGSVTGFNSPTWSGGGNAVWYTLDLDGDGKADLVQTSDPASGNVWGGDAAATWKVFLGSGSGFSKTATTWAVPPRGSVSGFDSTTWSGGGNAIWYTTDLNGDGKPDLVQTSDPASGGVWGGDGAGSWKVFLNKGSGFDKTALAWGVPSRGSVSGFNSTTWSGGGNAIWFTFDLNGDRRVDLVQTSDPTSGGVWGGDVAASWKVFYGEP